MLDLQAELEAARAIEKSLMDVHAALAELDNDGRRVVLIRAIAALEIDADSVMLETDPCARCKANERMPAKSWCQSCFDDHSAKVKAGMRHDNATKPTAAERETKKRHAAFNRGDCTKCLKKPALPGRRWCAQCREAYDASHGKAIMGADQKGTEPHVGAESKTDPAQKDPGLDREIVEGAIIDLLKQGPKDIFSITKAVWGVATLDMQRRARKILWAMKFDGVLKVHGNNYELS